MGSGDLALAQGAPRGAGVEAAARRAAVGLAHVRAGAEDRGGDRPAGPGVRVLRARTEMKYSFDNMNTFTESDFGKFCNFTIHFWH